MKSTTQHLKQKWPGPIDKSGKWVNLPLMGDIKSSMTYNEVHILMLAGIRYKVHISMCLQMRFK